LAFIANERWRAAVPELSTTSYVRVDENALSGMLMFAATVPPAAAAKAIAAAKKVMTTLTETPPSEAEMPGRVMSGSGPSPEMLLASAWLDAETYKLPPGVSRDVGRLRPDDIRRVAGRLFGNSAPQAIVVLGNAAELQTQLGPRIELPANAPETKPATTPALPPKKP
jgi:hypothetical protein